MNPRNLFVFLAALATRFMSFFRREKRPRRAYEEVKKEIRKRERGMVAFRHYLAGGGVHSGRSGFPNAPKRQPCPNCQKWVKRVSKTMNRADYYCSKCELTNIISLRG